MASKPISFNSVCARARVRVCAFASFLRNHTARVQDATRLVEELAAVTVQRPNGGINIQPVLQQAQRRGSSSGMSNEQKWASCIGVRGSPPLAFTAVRQECAGSNDNGGSDGRCAAAVHACSLDLECSVCLTAALTPSTQQTTFGGPDWVAANVPMLRELARGIPDIATHSAWCTSLEMLVGDLTAAANQTLADMDAAAVAAATAPSAAPATTTRVHTALEAMVGSACRVLTTPVGRTPTPHSSSSFSAGATAYGIYDRGDGDVYSALLDLYHVSSLV